tara:strand:- start:217 stop:444 length:228 start_codon:yes stop_codon:yes gene_type:complete
MVDVSAVKFSFFSLLKSEFFTKVSFRNIETWVTTLITKSRIVTTEASLTDSLFSNSLGLKRWVSVVIFDLSYHNL